MSIDYKGVTSFPIEVSQGDPLKAARGQTNRFTAEGLIDEAGPTQCSHCTQGMPGKRFMAMMEQVGQHYVI
eukprot:12885947-Prorocentrum_lima.AAC.1